MPNKYSYFQGTEEPKPKKKQYKSEKVEHEKARFKEPFYRNYDLYETLGNKSKIGPGSGWHQMMKNKSISEFLKKKRQKMKGKYKAASSLEILVKAIDFAIDDQINSDPILGD